MRFVLQHQSSDGNYRGRENSLIINCKEGGEGYYTAVSLDLLCTLLVFITSKKVSVRINSQVGRLTCSYADGFQQPTRAWPIQSNPVQHPAPPELKPAKAFHSAGRSAGVTTWGRLGHLTGSARPPARLKFRLNMVQALLHFIFNSHQSQPTNLSSTFININITIQIHTMHAQ